MTEPRSSTRDPESGVSPRAEPSASSRRRRLQESSVKKKALGLAVFLIVALSTLNALFGERGVLGLMAARADYEALATEIEALRRDNQSLANEIHALRTDPLAIERRAREVLGMARPGEISLEIQEPDDPCPSEAALVARLRRTPQGARTVGLAPGAFGR